MERTSCACDMCSIGCRTIPGFLVPGDIAALAEAVRPGRDPLRKYLRKSDGFVARGIDGRIYRVPTIVPAQYEDGECVSLLPDGKCSVHAVSPYGCRMFDSHMDAEKAGRLSAEGCRLVANDLAAGGPYAELMPQLSPAIPRSERLAAYVAAESLASR